MAPRKHAGRLFGFVMNTDVRLNVDFEKTPQIPKIKLRVERSDNVFVLKVKIECALRLLQFRDEALHRQLLLGQVVRELPDSGVALGRS